MLKEFFKKCLDDTTLPISAYDNAREKYKTMGEYLERYFKENYNLEVTIYPQGSFATRTAIRPYTDGKNKLYDVDIIIKIEVDKTKYLSSELKKMIKVSLDSSRYKDMYLESDKCFTVQFAQNGGYEFAIDLVPSVPEDSLTKSLIAQDTEVSESVDQAIAITASMSNSSANDWVTNNPKSYSSWFNDVHSMFNINRYKFETGLFLASIDELPDETEVNYLQNIVKALKRMMSVYYDQMNYQNKPASIIISTIAAKLSKEQYTLDEFDLLKRVIEQTILFSTYATSRNTLTNNNEIAQIIRREDGYWIMKNPCNGRDNLIDSWNDDPLASKNFMNFLKYLQENVLPALDGAESPINYQTIKKAFAASISIPESTVPRVELNSIMHTKPYYGKNV